MKQFTLIYGTVMALVLGAAAATNEPMALLQKGLFEEEANHDLAAAIQSYQAVVERMDRDRKLVATAVFRLGECYRKQGKTNEAGAQYERVMRDFSDQAILVDLSRKSLAELGRPPAAPEGIIRMESPAQLAARKEQERLLEDEIRLLQDRIKQVELLDQAGRAEPNLLLDARRELLQTQRKLAQLRASASGPSFSWFLGGGPSGEEAAPGGETAAAQAAVLEAQLEALRKMPEAQRLIVLQNEFPNPTLNSLMDRLAQAETELRAHELDFGPQHPEVVKSRTLIKILEKQLAEQVQGLLAALELRRDTALRMAEAVSDPAGARTPNAAAGSSEELRQIQELVAQSPDLVNAPGSEGLTLLQSAAARGKLDIAGFLLDHGAAVDGVQRPGLTPLHFAAVNGHRAMVELLLTRRAKVDATTQEGVTPLHAAAAKGYEVVAAALLDAGAEVNAVTTASASFQKYFQLNLGAGWAPLHAAAKEGFEKMVELLLSRKAEVNLQDAGARTALFYAARESRSTIVQALLEHGADVNAGSELLPLHMAVLAGDVPSVKLLLDRGADPNSERSGTVSIGGVLETYSFCTPLVLSVGKRQPELTAILVQAKGDLNSKLGAGPGLSGRREPLIFAAVADDRTLRVLLEAGADPNRRNEEGQTVLARAVEANAPVAVQLLLKHGADPDARLADESTALHLAKADRLEIARILLRGGANPNAQQRQGYTPLHQAAAMGQSDLAELLLKYKADPNLQAEDGRTPLDFVKESRRSPGGVPARAIRVPAGPSTVAMPSQASEPADLAALLRRHGALEETARMDRIRVRRGPADLLTLRRSETPDAGTYTVLECLAAYYDLISISPGGDAASRKDGRGLTLGTGMPYPDLARIVVHRPQPGTTNWSRIPVDLTPLLQAEPGDCSKDVVLLWGDVVEIPELDHPINEPWNGFSPRELFNFKGCLERKVNVTIKGEEKEIVLAPQVSWLNPSTPYAGPVQVLTGTSFHLKPVLLRSRLVLASSDLSRVRVTRPADSPFGGGEWVLDCSGNNAPAFWLRDADVIEIPDR